MPSYRQLQQLERVKTVWELAQRCAGKNNHALALEIRARFGQHPACVNRSAASIRADLMTYQRLMRNGQIN